MSNRKNKPPMSGGIAYVAEIREDVEGHVTDDG